MAYQLSDIYIGDFPVTQPFGSDPATYSARYGLKGHNGVDFGCPSMTLVLSASDGVVMESSFDENGYGNYITINHGDYKTLYGHLYDKLVNPGDRVVSGQLIAHSDNTGFSSGSHLHFGVAPIDGNGQKTEQQNGYSGYIDPMGSLCEWTIKNYQSPVIPSTATEATVEVKASDDSVKTAQANNYVAVVNFGLQNGFGVYLTNNGDSIDLKNNPGDTNGGTKLNKWISSLISENLTLKNHETTTPLTAILTDEQKNNILISLLKSLKGFVWQ